MQIHQNIDLALATADTPDEPRVGSDAHVSMQLLN
jgi:hypothetical protein